MCTCLLSRDKTIRLFEFGDIKYLTKKFGLFGSLGKTNWPCDPELQFSAIMQCQIKYNHLICNPALCTGRHFCLRCIITSTVARIASRIPCPQCDPWKHYSRIFRALLQQAVSFPRRRFTTLLQSPSLPFALDQVTV